MGTLNPDPIPETIRFEYTEAEGGLRYDDHYHNFHEFIVIIDGYVEYCVNGKHYLVKPVQAIAISNLENHEVVLLSGKYRRYLLQIRPEFFSSAVSDNQISSIFTQRPAHFNHIVSLTDTCVNELLALFKLMEKESEKPQSYTKDAVAALIKLIFISLFRCNPEAFPYQKQSGAALTVINVQHYIDEHFRENITLKNISSAFYINMYHLSHNFHEIIGYTFRDYLKLKRLSCAKDLLYSSNINIADVCRESGFSNVNNFIRTFHKSVGMSPSQYRKKSKLVT